MKNIPLKFSVILCAIFLTSCASNSEIELAEIDAIEDINEKPIESEILSLVNDYRAANGYATLEKLQVIKSQTANHTNYMIENEKISHDFFYQRKEFLTKNTNSTQVGENVAYGYSSAKSVFNAWLNSESHKKNIEGDYTHFEITAAQDANGKWYFTNIFIKK